MKSRKISFDGYLEENLKDTIFREHFIEQQEALRIGSKIAEYRKKAGLSQRELAKRVGMCKKNIARLEHTDYNSFTLFTLQRIALALGQRLEVNFVSTSTRRGCKVITTGI